MEMDRRHFVELATGLVVAAVLPGCASVAVTRITSSDGELRLAIRDYPQLTRPGGYLKVQAANTGMLLYVLALDGGRYVALSPICTHLGCTVNIEGPHLVCPCHGSTYARSGEVLRGPAERPLQVLASRLTPAGELVIHPEGGA